METREQLMQALTEIEQWEQEQKDLWFWEKLGRIPFMFLDKLTPTFLQEKIGQAIDELSTYVETGGRYLVREQDVLNRFARYATPTASIVPTVTPDQVGYFPLEVMDSVADELIHAHKQYATVQGATTGFGGIFTLVIDIPLLLGLSLKVLQEMAIAYGYAPSDKRERIFIVKCLQFSSSDIVGKRAIIEELSAFHKRGKKAQGLTQLQAWREVIMTYRDNYGWKKLFQLIPVVGLLFGAYLNRKTVEEVAEAGKMMYRKRRILERLEIGNQA